MIAVVLWIMLVFIIGPVQVLEQIQKLRGVL